MEKIVIGRATLYHGNCSDIIPLLVGVDSIITSPPYARQRDYTGVDVSDYPDWAGGIIEKCAAISVNVFWNIKEHAENGAKNDYVYRMVANVIGRNIKWVDEFIWVKTNPFPTGSQNRLKDGFERIYHFGEGKLFPDNVAERSTSKYADDSVRRKNKGEHNVTNGSGLNMSKRVVAEKVRPSNVITLPVDSTNHFHPATFPVGLPTFFVKLSTQQGGTVLDPFMGSGTTGIACMDTGRNFIGIEIDRKYFDIACKRIEQAQMQMKLSL